MRLPMQASPVMRGQLLFMRSEGVRQSGCNVLDWVVCGATVAACAPACVAGPATCALCMGAAYDRCQNCL